MEDKITMSHGSGGEKSEELIRELFLPYFNSSELNRLNDSAYVKSVGNRVVFTTDSFVVKPLFFPGGDIGKLAVYGTVNDLSVMKARPKVLALAFIFEEGFGIKKLRKVLSSIKYASLKAGVKIVAGDTKVVGRGKADGMYITTSGIGELLTDKFRKARSGDALIVSKSIAEHGLAVISQREGFNTKVNIKSDCNTLFPVVREIVKIAPEAPFMRDATRGGLAVTLNKLVAKFNLGAVIKEHDIPIKPEVRLVCDSLKVDPLNVANEGVLLAVVPKSKAEIILRKIKKLPQSHSAEIIGYLTDDFRKAAVMQTIIGGKRIIDKPRGEISPRIC